ncbi:MAG: DUF1800 family protein, partial [Proteobacteria bacterium]|nr:DUF1800 family protein [Pseudomonadota bacterium]
MNAISAATTAAVNRFGLGARPDELQGIGDPRGWLETQIASGASGAQAFAALPSSLDYLKREGEYKLERRRFRQDAGGQGEPGADPQRRALFGGAPATSSDAAGNGVVTATEARKRQALPPEVRELQRGLREDFFSEAAARFRLAATTTTPFMERLVHFWSNHFAVSLDKAPARLFAAPMEREAIRPHVNGRFADMLLAVEKHPAMLRYLDNVQSIGPDSPVGERVAARLAEKGGSDKGKAGGLNENLGREIMELHTLGVDGGYTQADVTGLARALTGWGTPAPKDFDPDARRGRFASFANHEPPDSAFAFRAAAHEPSARTVMGRT